MAKTRDQVYDELLVLRCQEGDRKAFAELVDRWHPRLVGCARRLLGEEDSAREAVQDVWLAITKGIHQLKEVDHFRSWALSIVSHKCADRTRTEQKHRHDSIRRVDEAEAPIADSQRDAHEELRRLVDQLSMEHRQVATLYYQQDMSIVEIAQALGIAPGTVKSRLHYARLALRRDIEENGHG